MGGMNICVFYFDRIRTLVAMATWKFPLTCMEKKWKFAFSVVRLGIFEFCFYINVY